MNKCLFSVYLQKKRHLKNEQKYVLIFNLQMFSVILLQNEHFLKI
jgi:hypothetical protein